MKYVLTFSDVDADVSVIAIKDTLEECQKIMVEEAALMVYEMYASNLKENKYPKGYGQHDTPEGFIERILNRWDNCIVIEDAYCIGMKDPEYNIHLYID